MLGSCGNRALVVGEGQRYLACLLNLRTKESKGGKRGGSAQLHDCALAAAARVASDATTVKAAYFCDKFRGYLLEGITRCNLEDLKVAGGRLFYVCIYLI